MSARDQILALDRRHVLHPYSFVDDPRPPLVIARAAGARIHDVDGRSFLDGNSSWWVAGLGHGHPRLIGALRAQAERLAHVSLAGITHEPAAALAAELCAVAPAGLTRCFFSDDGSTAIEAALKLAVQFWAQTGQPQKRRFLAIGEAFHGETAGAASLGGVELFRRAAAPLLIEVLRAPDVAAAAALVAEHGASLAGVVVEPMVRGAAGMLIDDAPPLAALAAACRAHDVLLIADEVFVGYGRTGPMWACDHAGIAPDLLCLGKTFCGGLLPMAATLLGERIADAFRGDRSRAFLYGHSFCGNPLGAAVAREVLAVFRDEAVLDQVRAKAPRLRAAVDAAAARSPGSTRPRALGLVAALDLAGGGGYLGAAGWRVYDHALAHGAILRPLGDTVYLAPPLTISDADLAELCDIFVAAVGAASSSSGGTP